MKKQLNDTMITFRWNDTNERDIRSVATDYGISLGSLIRRVLTAYLKSKNRYTSHDKKTACDNKFQQPTLFA